MTTFIGIYCCKTCKAELTLRNDNLCCMGCGSKYPVIDGIPCFEDPVLSEKKGGFASKLFKSPTLYRLFVELKFFIARDDYLNFFAEHEINTLLSVGCGSNIKSRQLEYEFTSFSEFSGVDISLPFVRSARDSSGSDAHNFCVASASSLPFPDNSYEVVFLPYVLHHTPIDFRVILDEAVRVCSRYVVVYDHIKSGNSKLWRFIQTIYWRVMDGGYQYLDGAAWKELLGNYTIHSKVQTGLINKHVIKFALSKHK